MSEKKILYIIGDSHTELLSYIHTHYYKPNNILFLFTRLNAKTAWNLNLKKEELISEKGSIFNYRENKEIIIMPALGEVDIRFHLHFFKNTKEVVKKYVNEVVNHFQNNQVKFLLPVPPSSFENLEHSEGSILERKLIYNDFCFYLEEESKNHNLLPPVSILEALGCDEILNKDYRDGCHLSNEKAIKVLEYLDNTICFT